MIRIIVILMLSWSVARADATEEARKYFDAGRQAYDAGQYLPAISSFEEAFKLSPRASITFALAQSYRRQYSIDRDDTKLLRAGELYRKYLLDVKQGERRDEAARYLGEIEPLLLKIEEARKGGAGRAVAPIAQPTQLMVSSQIKGARGSIDGGPLSEVPVVADVKPGPHKVRVEAEGYFTIDLEATAVESRLIVAEAKLVEKPGELALKAVAGAEIIVDGKPMGRAPLGKPLSLPAGKHYVAVVRRGHAGWSRELTLARGEARALDATLVRTTQRKVAYGVFVGAGALVLASGITGIVNLKARSDASDLETKIAGGMGTVDDLAEHNRLAGKASDFATATQVLFAGALAVGAAGALLYYLDLPRAADSSGTIVPTVVPGGGGAAYITRF